MVGGDTAVAGGEVGVSVPMIFLSCGWLGMLFENFKSSVFDSYVRGLWFDKRV